jgi:hypothetical protein
MVFPDTETSRGFSLPFGKDAGFALLEHRHDARDAREADELVSRQTLVMEWQSGDGE